ncbi:MAG: MbcA/ParS/Xre antitoxin family protein [Sphingobacteriaceae bacterium]|nr:MbcA/ParS/Xre antitoxin family protein [Sphingobacteriaceae bacterium]
MDHTENIVSDFIASYQIMPQGINQTQVLAELQRHPISGKHLSMLKAASSFTDEQMADWLNLNVKTFRAYKQSAMAFKVNLQEHVLLLLKLFKHGAQVFGSSDAFDTWMRQPNFALGQQAPVYYLHTISGIQWLDDHLIGMAYGDNA